MRHEPLIEALLGPPVAYGPSESVWEGPGSILRSQMPEKMVLQNLFCELPTVLHCFQIFRMFLFSRPGLIMHRYSVGFVPKYTNVNVQTRTW